MIAITTTHRGTRIYTVPRALLDVARRLFPHGTDADAFFSLARRLTADRLASIECLAYIDMEHATQRAAALIGH